MEERKKERPEKGNNERQKYINKTRQNKGGKEGRKE